jgi:hypothetical protein
MKTYHVCYDNANNDDNTRWGVSSGMMGNPVEVKTGMNREEAERLAEKMEQELTDRVNKIFGLEKAADPAKNTAA